MSFEGNTLRLLETQGKKVIRWHSALFNTALVRRGTIADPSGLAQVLAKAVKSGGFKGRDVFVSLDGTNTLFRTVPVPGDAQASDFITREARRLWAINPDESLLYWQPVARKQGQFFVLCLPKDALSAIAETARLAGLRPLVVDTRPLCLARALNESRAVAVCAESNSIVVVILVDCLPVMMQTHWLTEGPLSPEGMAGQVSNLLGQALAYYNDSHASDRLPGDTPLFICGAAADQAVRERAQAGSGYPLRELSPVFSGPADFPVSQFAVNLGLLMKVV